MTRTEDRLADALRASAGRVGDDRLRPLAEPGQLVPGQLVPGQLLPGHPPGPAGAPRRERQGIGNWLVPAGAAAAVVLAVALALAVAGGVRPGAGGPRATAIPGGAALPKYFATLSGSIPPGLDFTVRSSATGAVVAHVRSPMVKGWTVWPDTMAAGPDGRTFYLEADAYGSPSSSLPQQIWIYRLTVPGGRLTRVAVLPGAARYGGKASLAVSPDGRRLALTAIADRAGQRGYADAVVVVDLRTGARHTWKDGLYRPGKLFMIQKLSWAANGRSLVFLGLWCDYPDSTCLGGTSSRGYYDAQVRSLSLTEGGGTLGRSALLVSRSARYPVITDVAAGPGPAQLTLLVLSGRPRSGAWPVVSVDRVSAATGALLSVAYRAEPHGTAKGRPYGASISADPGGKNLLFTYPGSWSLNAGWGGLYTGSISQGKLTLLPFRQPYGGWPVTAW